MRTDVTAKPATPTQLHRMINGPLEGRAIGDLEWLLMDGYKIAACISMRFPRLNP